MLLHVIIFARNMGCGTILALKIYLCGRKITILAITRGRNMFIKVAEKLFLSGGFKKHATSLYTRRDGHQAMCMHGKPWMPPDPSRPDVQLTG